MATNYKATDVANLTPEQIAYLQSLYAPASNSGYQAPLDPSASFGGQEIAPMWNMTTGSGEESGRTQYGPATGYQLAVEPGQWDIGDWRHNFDAQGNYQNTGQRDNDAVTDAMKGLAIMAPAFAATMFPSLGAAMSFGANPVLSGASATGATQAAGALGSLTGAASSAASPTLSKAALDGTNIFGANSIPGALDISALSAAAPGLESAAAMDAITKSLGYTAPAASSSLLDTATNTLKNVAGSDLTGKLLGTAATIAGAAAGAQGNEQSQTTSRDIPEWLKPHVNKLLDYQGGLLDRQMAPGYMQGYDDMRTKGQGLLAQQIAGNGFSRFFPGR
jgi:hypothetical protein